MKRLIDIFITTFLLVLSFPLMVLIYGAVRLRMGPPVLFRQTRAGINGRPFILYKFRTMNDNRDSQGRLLPDGQRLTGLGRFLRRASLDELPQLGNVLKGNMSLVGPRPLLVEYLPRYSAQQMRRHEVLPGITGLAQVEGRNSLSWDEKFRLDVQYVDNRSLAIDFQILSRTVIKSLSGNGIFASDVATMPEFQGGQHRNLR